MTGPRRPPRLPAWLLERIGGRRAAYMLGDLDEEYERFVLPKRGPLRAGLWYWMQIARSVPSAIRPPSGHSATGSPRRPVPLPPLGRELRYATRCLVREPRFSLAVVLTLGVGVGAGMSVFSLVDFLLLRPPSHVEDPDRVKRLVLQENRYRPPFGEFTSTSLAWIDYEVMRDVATTLDGVAAWFPTTRSMGRGAGARNITVTLATASLFPTLGVRPALGRFFTNAEDVPGRDPAPCVASERFWRRELGGHAGALGREILVGTVTCVIVGVAPAGFSGVEPTAVQIWMPIRTAAGDVMGGEGLWTTDRSHWVRVLARFAPGVSEDVAAQDATAAYRSVTARGRDPELRAVADWQSIMPGRSTRSSIVDVSVLLLAGGGVLLLLIVVNLMNLFVVRELGRARETAVHVALGSSPGRLFVRRGLEASLLAGAAGAVGLVVATWLGPIVRNILVTNVDFAESPMTMRILAVTAAIAMATGLSIAAISTARLRSIHPAPLLSSAGTARSGGARRGPAIRLGFVGIQAALSTALLVASLGFVNSFRRAATLDLGFDRHDVLVASLPLYDLNYSRAESWEFYRQLHERVSQLPGIATASLGYMTPWWNNRTETVSVPGRDSLPPVPSYGSPVFDAVTPDYLSTLGLTMRAGRWLQDTDRAGTTPVVVINDALAELYWAGENPIGRCMRIGDAEGSPCREVVGVVANHRFTGGIEDDAVAAYFLPLAQADGYSFTPRLFARASRDAVEMVGPLRRLVQSAEPDLPAATVMLLESRYEPLIAPWRLGSYAFTALGALAMLVGTLGLFSVLSYVVAERRREFAIRAAIGATSRQIAWPVVRGGLGTVAAGIAAGFGLALAASGVLQPLLFRTRLADPLALGIAAGVSLVIALVATLAPARTAASQSPMEALRVE